MRSTVEYGSRPKYAKPGMLTPMLLPPGSSEKPKCKPRRANWKRNSLKSRSLRTVSCWKVTLRSRDWVNPVREPAFCPKTWFWEVEGWPVTSEGETPTQIKEVLGLLH